MTPSDNELQLFHHYYQHGYPEIYSEIKMIFNVIYALEAAFSIGDMEYLDFLLVGEEDYFNGKTRAEVMEYFRGQFAARGPGIRFPEEDNIYVCYDIEPWTLGFMVGDGSWPVDEDHEPAPKIIVPVLEFGLIKHLKFGYHFRKPSQSNP